MKKNDKYKPLAKTTLFGEKLTQAREQKINIEKPLPTVPTKKNLPVIVAPPVIEESELRMKIADDIKLIESEIEVETSNTETKDNESNSAITEKTAPANEFRKIMDFRFAENAKATIPLIRMGIDLGTSFSKVVWRLGEANVFPVCFGENNHDLNDYLMPSIVSFELENIRFGFESASSSQNSISNFKMCLACESKNDGLCNIKKCSLTDWKTELFPADLKNEETKFANALFLAKLLARTKEIILSDLKTNHDFPSTVKPKWTANYAVPDTFIEQSEIAVVFREVLRIAWLMAEIFVEKPELTDRNILTECYFAAQDLARESGDILNDEEFGCSPYPEIGAEVACIVMPRKLEPGLYAFVDVGAGTIDASVFRYYRDGENAQRPPYAAEVFKLGAAHIEARANRQFTKNSAHWLKKVKEEYLNLTENERGQLLEPIFSFLNKAEQSVKNEVHQSLITVFSQAYAKERIDSRWLNLKLILGGGGSKLKSYQDSAVDAFTLNRNSNKPTTPTTVDLLKPDDFQMSGLPQIEFYRFAVAYGLSYDIAKLPPTIFAKDVAPILIVSKTKNKRDRDGDR